ncbi:hypothetical protein [Sphaerotilus sp.]|uniref:hypothetical protein n=1 Tax=Sphaerotilus sp. TaxID=2093942 RepID=UPI002ACE3877|nr:hypothetical protein [Sphaerotilus sp.]MDZ7855353.1 hypothetical protein [Sphaerotilus sp.]
MSFETDSLFADPADEAALYVPVAAWEPMRRGGGRQRPPCRSETVRRVRSPEAVHPVERPAATGTAAAHPVSLEYPTIRSDWLNAPKPVRVSGSAGARSAETTNLVPQSAFLKARLATQVVTQGTMPSSFQPMGVSMLKPDVFASRTGSSSAPLPGLSRHSDFAHSASPSLCTERLDVYGARWLQSLPVSIRPIITAKRHPHIVNKFAILWGVDEGVDAYFDELLISSRPGRRGFAMEVLDELVELQRAVQEKRRF